MYGSRDEQGASTISAMVPMEAGVVERYLEVALKRGLGMVLDLSGSLVRQCGECLSYGGVRD